MIVQNRFTKVSKKTKNKELCENCCAIKSFSLTLHSFLQEMAFCRFCIGLTSCLLTVT